MRPAKPISQKIKAHVFRLYRQGETPETIYEATGVNEQRQLSLVRSLLPKTQQRYRKERSAIVYARREREKTKLPKEAYHHKLVSENLAPPAVIKTPDYRGEDELVGSEPPFRPLWAR